MDSNFQISPNIKYTPLSFERYETINRKRKRAALPQQEVSSFSSREIIISSGFARFPPFSISSPISASFPCAASYSILLIERPPPSPLPPNRRMRRESLARVTLLLKTMKQTLYERGYGANYLAISRPSNK